MKFTDTQAAVLPLPSHLRGGAIAKVCDALKAKGLAVAICENGEERLLISDGGRQALELPIGLPPIAEPQSTTVRSERRKPRTNTKQTHHRDAQGTGRRERR